MPLEAFIYKASRASKKVAVSLKCEIGLKELFLKVLQPVAVVQNLSVKTPKSCLLASLPPL